MCQPSMVPRAIDPATPGDVGPESLTLASAEDVAEALAYALRYNERGKPRHTSAGWDFAAGTAAEHLVQHLARAGFLVVRRRPRPAHTAG
jgi:hypothetical protein